MLRRICKKLSWSACDKHSTSVMKDDDRCKCNDKKNIDTTNTNNSLNTAIQDNSNINIMTDTFNANNYKYKSYISGRRFPPI